MSITLLSVCSGSSMALRQSYKKNAIIFFFRQNLSFPNINHRFMRRSKSCKKTGRRGSGSSGRFPECFPERCGVVLRGGNPAKPSVTLYFFRQGVEIFLLSNRPKRAENDPFHEKYRARACDFIPQSCPDRKKLLFLFVIWRVVPRGGRRSDADPRAQSVL